MITFIIVVLLILSVAFLYGMLSRETGFKILTTADGKPRFGVPGIFDSFFEQKKEEDKSAFQKWRERKKTEKELWYMYTATAVMGIMTSVLVSSVSDKATGIACAAIVVLLMLHLVVWPFYTEKTSIISKLVISGIIIFYPAALFIPNFADGVYGVWRIVKKAGSDGSVAVVRVADDYEKGKPLWTPDAAPSPRSQSSQTVKHVVANPGNPDYLGSYTWVNIPDRSTFKELKCPSGVYMVVIHKEEPQGARYDCSSNAHINFDGMIGLELGFVSKTSEPVRFTVAYTTKG